MQFNIAQYFVTEELKEAKSWLGKVENYLPSQQFIDNDIPGDIWSVAMF